MAHHNKNVERIADVIEAALKPLGFTVVEQDGMRVVIRPQRDTLRVVLEIDRHAAEKLVP